MIHLDLGVQVAIVRCAELGALSGLVCKRLHHTHARQRILELRVYARNLAAIVGKGGAHRKVLMHHNSSEHAGHSQNGKRELRGKREKNNERAHNLNGADDDPLRHVVGSLADIKEVVNHAAHHVARAHAIKVGKPHTLVLVKQILAHLGLHARAHNVAPCRDKVAAATTHQVQKHQTNSNVAQGPHNGLGPFAKKSVSQTAQNAWKREVNRGNHNGSHRVGYKEMHLRLVVGKESPEHAALIVLTHERLRRIAQAVRNSIAGKSANHGLCVLNFAVEHSIDELRERHQIDI